MATLPYGWDIAIPSGAPSPSGECHKWLSNFIWMQGAFSSSSASGGGNNKLVNGSFSTTPVSTSGWTKYDGASFWTSASGRVGGAAKVYGGSTASAGVYQDFIVQPSTQYTLDLHYKCISASGGWIIEELPDQLIGRTNLNAEVWTKSSQNFVTSSSAASVRLRIYASPSGSVWYDELTVYSDGGGFHRFPGGGSDSGRHLLSRAALMFVGGSADIDAIDSPFQYSIAFDTNNAQFKYYCIREEFDYDGEDGGPFVVGEELAVAGTVIGILDEIQDNGDSGSMTTVRAISYAGTLADDDKLVGQTSEASAYINGTVTQASAWAVIDDFLSADTPQTITSNIVFETAGGSVDGRKYSTDGAKLDSINSEARHMVLASGTIANGLLIPWPQDDYVYAASGDNQVTNGDFNDLAGYTTIIDSGATGHTVAISGDTFTDLEQKKFGTSSIRFDGTGDTLYIPDHNDWNFGADKVTIDFWVRFASIPASGNFAYGIVQQYQDSGNYWIMYYQYVIAGSASDLSFAARSGGSPVILVAQDFTPFPGKPAQDTWYHIALVRGWQGDADTWAFTIDGASCGGTSASGTMPDLPANLDIGNYSTGAVNQLNGWIDEFRVSKGAARWTENFTPPSTAYNSDASTHLLLHGDNSMLPSAWTPSGSSCYLIVRDGGQSGFCCEVSAGSAGKYMYQDVNIAAVSAASSDYVLSFYVQPSSTIISTPQYAVYDLSNISYIVNWTNIPSTVAASGQWTEVTNRWTQPVDCASMRLMLAASGAGQQVFYDTVDMRKWCGELTTPSSGESMAWIAGIQTLHAPSSTITNWYATLNYHEDLGGPEVITNGLFNSGASTGTASTGIALSGWGASMDYLVSGNEASMKFHKGGVSGSCASIKTLYAGAPAFIYQSFEVSAGERYIVDFYHQEGDNKLDYRIVDITNSTDIISRTSLASCTSAFVRDMVNFVVPTGCVSARLIFQTSEAGGTQSVSVDSVSAHQSWGHHRKANVYAELASGVEVDGTLNYLVAGARKLT